MRVGQIWTYIESGKEYEIIDYHKMKIGEADWVDGVTYRCLQSSLVFTRDLETFKKKFLVKDVS